MSEVEPLLAHLYSADAREAADRLVALGAPAVEPLLDLLDGRHSTPDWTQFEGFGAAPDANAARERAAYILGDIGDPRAVEPLIAACARESDRYIRLAAVLALGSIGDPRALPMLITALDTPAWTPAYARIVDDFARIAGASAVEPLIRVVRSAHYTYGGAAHAARALAHLRADPCVLPGLIAALRPDAEIATVEALIDVLAETGDPRAAGGLIGFVGALIRLPPERWDDRDENRSETDQGVEFHIFRTYLQAATGAVRRMGSLEAITALERLLGSAPGHVAG